MEQKVIRAFCLCDKDIGGDLPSMMASLVSTQLGYITDENFHVEYGNIMIALNDGEKISDRMEQYIHYTKGEKYLKPPYSVVKYNETIKDIGVSMCIYLIVEGGTALTEIEKTILERASRLKALGRVDEAISCLYMGWPVANRSTFIKKEADRMKYEFALQIRNDPEGEDLSDMLLENTNQSVLSLLSSELPGDLDLLELQVLIAFHTKRQKEYAIFYDGESDPEYVSFKDMMAICIKEFRAKNGVSKEVDRIESTLVDKSKSSFFGRKSK